jgi:hypothetical protein
LEGDRVLVPIETMIDGLVRTLTERVLPDVPTRFARGQLYAVIDVLRNLRDRVEPRASLLDDESASIAAALDRLVPLLSGSARTALAAAVAGVPASPPAARLDALRAALNSTLDAIDDLPADAAGAARAAIAEHLAAQTMRDLAVLKPSMVGEISKG